MTRGDLVTVAVQGDQGKPRPAFVVPTLGARRTDTGSGVADRRGQPAAQP